MRRYLLTHTWANWGDEMKGIGHQSRSTIYNEPDVAQRAAMLRKMKGEKDLVIVPFESED